MLFYTAVPMHRQDQPLNLTMIYAKGAQARNRQSGEHNSMGLAQAIMVPMTHRFLIHGLGKPSNYWGLIILSHSHIYGFLVIYPWISIFVSSFFQPTNSRITSLGTTLERWIFQRHGLHSKVCFFSICWKHM